MKANINDEILVKYLLGEASQEERNNVEVWTAATEDNKRYFEHFRIIWDESRQLASQSAVNENEAWQRFVQRTRQHEADAVTQLRVNSSARFNWARAAAILILISCAGWLGYMFMGPKSELIADSGSKVLIQTLPDGSTVTLNKNSSLTYPAEFHGDTRVVTLRGEGFFNITPNKQKPFIIHAGNTSVKVVGTSFNVKSTQEQTEVIVETGIVEVAKNSNAVRLLPHQKATVSRDGNAPVMEEIKDELYNYYRTKEFVCHGTPLRKLVDALNEAFDAHIVIENRVAGDLQLDAVFHGDSLDEILNVVSGSFPGILVEKRGKEIVIK